MISDFKNAIEQVFTDFENRLKQQELFQIQTELLRQVQNEIEIAGYCQLESVKNISLTYKEFYNQLKESGRSYENIIAEKSLVDTYSAFEIFLSDCLYMLYKFHPKFLGKTVKVDTTYLLITKDTSLCEKYVIEHEVKGIIQSNNIMKILNIFKQEPFKLSLGISGENIFWLYEISLIRNLIVHSKSIVNSIYINSIKEITPKYSFQENHDIFSQLNSVVADAKTPITIVSEQIKVALIHDAQRLYTYHSTK
ncbi:MAG: hypothetical protein WAX77_09765 [Methylococcaceae bacterium]